MKYVARRRYMCKVCGRFYKKIKLDPKAHCGRSHGLDPITEADIEELPITINGIPIMRINPVDLVTFRNSK